MNMEMPMPAPDGYVDMTPVVRRKIAWDMLPHDEVIPTFEALGIVIGSHDVLTLEHQESEARQQSMMPLLPLGQVLAGIATEVFGAAYLRPVPDGEITDDMKARFNEQNFQVIRSAVFAVIGQFLESGMLRMAGPAGVPVMCR
jgi:hypothetical protein